MNHRRYTYLVGEDILLLKRKYTSFLRETHRLFMHGGMGALLLWLLTLTACVGEELQKPLLGEGEGYLTLQIGAISAEVTSDPLTKATLENLPDSTEFTIVIKDTNGNEVKHYDKLSLIDNPLVLNAGVKYIVEASYGTNDTLQYTPYFYGSDSIYIQANTNNPVSLKPSLGNAMITPVVSDNLSKHYTDYSVTANVNGRTLPFPSGKSLFAKAGSTISLTFAGTNLLGVETSYTSPATEPLQAGKNYLLQCDPEFSKCSSIQVNATIDPIIENGWLNGSKVSLSYSSPDGAQTKNITAWHVDVHYNNNGIDNIIRTYEGVAPNATIMDQDSNWPYVPKGSEITAYVVIEGDHIPVKTSKTVNPIPSEVIKITGTTSYDLYKAEKISEANGMDAGTIKDIGAKAKIANALLSNPNYSHTFTLTYGDDKYFSKTDTITVGDKTGQSWGNHPITATMVFDGQSIVASKDCHITGLPYSAKPPTKSGDHPWTEVPNWSSSTFSWEESQIVFYTTIGSGTISIFSPIFHIPDPTIPAIINISAHGHVGSLSKYNISTRVYTNDNEYVNFTILHNNGAYPSNDYSDSSLYLNNTFSKIKIENCENVTGRRLYIQSVNIKYRSMQ